MPHIRPLIPPSITYARTGLNSGFGRVTAGTMVSPNMCYEQIDGAATITTVSASLVTANYFSQFAPINPATQQTGTTIEFSLSVNVSNSTAGAGVQVGLWINNTNATLAGGINEILGEFDSATANQKGFISTVGIRTVVNFLPSPWLILGWSTVGGGTATMYGSTTGNTPSYFAAKEVGVITT